MSDPATPTPQQRAQTRATAARVMESVRRDERMPLPFDSETFGKVDAFCRDDVEDPVFRLAQEIELLVAESKTHRARVARLADALPVDEGAERMVGELMADRRRKP